MFDLLSIWLAKRKKRKYKSKYTQVRRRAGQVQVYDCTSDMWVWYTLLSYNERAYVDQNYEDLRSNYKEHTLKLQEFDESVRGSSPSSGFSSSTFNSDRSSDSSYDPYSSSSSFSSSDYGSSSSSSYSSSDSGSSSF